MDGGVAEVMELAEVTAVMAVMAVMELAEVTAVIELAEGDLIQVPVLRQIEGLRVGLLHVLGHRQSPQLAQLVLRTL
jgi:hypothetical protein